MTFISICYDEKLIPFGVRDFDTSVLGQTISVAV